MIPPLHPYDLNNRLTGYVVRNRAYRLKDDSLWANIPEPPQMGKLYYYHCDHLGTPQEMTDEEGNIVWQAQYKTWGEARITTEKVRNNLRFQGQYLDHETGLHYNRHRYYDPKIVFFLC